MSPRPDAPLALAWARGAWLATLAVGLCACAASPPTDGGTHAPDAGAAVADGGDAGAACAGSLEIGLCRIRATGGSCRGSLYEPTEFVPTPDGALVPLVIGEQGSPMLGLAIRTRGIAPGDPSRPSDTDNPALEVRLVDAGGALVAVYRGRVAFVPDPEDPTLLVCPAVDVITEPDIGGAMTATATLRDHDGVTRCGRRLLTVVR